MTYYKNENGSALVTVLMLVTAMGVLSGAILMAFAVHYGEIRRDFHQTQAFYLAEAGVYKALWYLSGHDGRNLLWRPIDRKIDLIDGQTSQITVTERGGFLRIQSAAVFKNQKQQVDVLVGQVMPIGFNSAVIVGGVDHSLVVTGKTQLTGNVTVGKGGVKSGTIRGTRFTGNRLVNGEITIVTPPVMPDFDSVIFQNSLSSFKRKPPGLPSEPGENKTSEKVVYIDGIVDFSTLLDSIGTQPIFLYSAGSLNLSGDAQIKQPMRIMAEDTLILAGNLSFDDVMIYSPQKVIVRDHVSGSLQVLSGKNILLQGQVALTYPSVLFCLAQLSEKRLHGEIRLEGNARVTGTIILAESAGLPQNTPRRAIVVIAESARLTGVLYASNYATVRGRVNGLVITDRFYLYESPTVYINWLKNAVINRTSLKPGFRLPLYFGDRPHLEIIKWY